MNHPQKYKTLMRVFKEKRDPKLGGVPDYDSDFYVTYKELEALGLGDKIEIKDMLDRLAKTVVRPADENGIRYETKVIASHRLTDEEITIIGGKTVNFDQFLIKIEHELKESGIFMDKKEYPTMIRYRIDDPWLKLSQAGRRKAFNALLKNYPEIVSYEQLSREIGLTVTDQPLNKEEKKRVLNCMNGLMTRMCKQGLPKNAIVHVRGKGYKLDM